MLLAQAKLGDSEHAIHDVIGAADTIVHQVWTTVAARHEQRRRLALRQAGGHLDIDLAPVIEGTQRPPGRIVALDAVTEVELVEAHATIGDALPRQSQHDLTCSSLSRERARSLCRLGRPHDIPHSGNIPATELAYVVIDDRYDCVDGALVR